MDTIRIDENSTDNRISQVLELPVGGVFSMPDNFVPAFMKIVPEDKKFSFSKKEDGTYEVTDNRNIIRCKWVDDLQE